MFTIKLMMARNLRGPNDPSTDERPQFLFSTKIVEGVEIDVHILRHNELSEIAVLHADGKTSAFYIANRDKPRPEGFADEVVFYYAAYIENATGKTTEKVTF